MNSLIIFVMAHVAATIAIGLVAARRVHSSPDYMVAGRRTLLYIIMATVFATWFGAETVLSVSATFAKDGLGGLPGGPFGASVCVVLAALLITKLFYRMNLMRIGNFYKQRYGKTVEVITSFAIVGLVLGLDVRANHGAGLGDSRAFWQRSKPEHIFIAGRGHRHGVRAVRGKINGGLIYFCFDFVSIFIAYAALVTDPAVAKLFG